MSDKSHAPSHPLMQTWVRSINYDFVLRTGGAHCEGPVDMDGTIKVFTSIDPNVETIGTYIDGVPDTSYIKQNGKWVSI